MHGFTKRLGNKIRLLSAVCLSLASSTNFAGDATTLLCLSTADFYTMFGAALGPDTARGVVFQSLGVEVDDIVSAGY
jgi:hypothetical protein